MPNSYLQKELKLTYFPVMVILTNNLPNDAVEFNPAETSGFCSLAALREASKGKTIFFAKDTKGCPGLKAGLGFEETASIPGGIEYFLSCGRGEGFPEGEKLKKTPGVAKAYYDSLPKITLETKYIVLRSAVDPDKDQAKLAVFLVNPDQLSALIHLFAYESTSYDCVLMPSCSGCASIFKLPLAELKKDHPRGVVGLVDIWARPPFAADLFAFTVPFDAYLQMLKNSTDCFFQAKTWDGIKKRLK